MAELTWHLERAKAVLEEWYQKVDALLFYSELAVSRYKSQINIEGSNQYKRTALHCKTAGLVWHDRYKMLLDTQRSGFK